MLDSHPHATDFTDHEVALCEGVLDLVRDRPVAIDEIVERLDSEGLFAPFGLDDPDDRRVLVADLLMYEPRIWTTRDDLVASAEQVLTGRVFTHRLTERELHEGALELEPDFAVLESDLNRDDLRLGDGRELTIVHDRDESWHALSGPTGWLSGFGVGDLVGLRREGSHLSVEAIDDVADGSAECAAILAELSPTLEKGSGEEILGDLFEVLVHDPELFTTPVAPISELLTGAGLTRDGPFFGPGDQLWDRRGVALGVTRARVARRYELDRCCVAAVETIGRAWRAHVLSAHHLDAAPDTARLSEALAHGAAAFAFLDEVDGYAPRSQLQAFALSAQKAAPDEAGPLGLAALVDELGGDPLAAESNYRRALQTDPRSAPATIRLGWIEYERSNFRAALQHFRQIWTDDNPQLPAVERLLTFTRSPGRNERCPCGSGRKYKACHSPQPVVEPEHRATVLLHKMLRFISDSRRLDDLAISATVAGFDLPTLLESQFVVETLLLGSDAGGAYRKARGALLPPEEADLLDDVLAERLRVVEVVDVSSGAGLTVRDLVDDEVIAGLGPGSENLRRIGADTVMTGDGLFMRLTGGGVFGQVHPIRDDLLDEAIDLARSNLDGWDVIRWYAAALLDDHEYHD